MTDDVMSGGRFAAPNRTGDMVTRKAGAVSATEPSRTKGDWMQRIAILGASGAGKTVLARTLGALLDLPVTHLDQLRYDADWSVVPEPEFFAAQRRLVAGRRWIADGNSLASLPVRAAAADTIIVLDPHPVVCLTGIAARRLRYRGGQHADGVYDRITLEVLKYAATYRARHLPRVQDCLREHAIGATVVHLRSRRAVTRYVAQVRAVGRSS